MDRRPVRQRLRARPTSTSATPAADETESPVELRIRTVSGDVRITRAGAPVACDAERRPTRVLDSLRGDSRAADEACRDHVPIRTLATVLGVFAVAWAFVAARQAVLWIFIALFLAIVLTTPVTWLEQRGLKRGNAAMLVVLALVSFLVGLAYLLDRARSSARSAT